MYRPLALPFSRTRPFCASKVSAPTFSATSSQQKVVVPVSDAEEKNIEALIRLIWRYCAAKPFLYTVVSPLLEALFEQYAALSERAQQKGGKVAASRKEELFRGFLALVSEHWLDERELAWYADALCISVHYLCEAVYAVGGHYPKHYIRQTIVSEAKYLLCYTGGSAAAIAAELNFPSPAYFNRFFKRETGLTPGEFRKKNRISHKTTKPRHSGRNVGDYVIPINSNFAKATFVLRISSLYAGPDIRTGCRCGSSRPRFQGLNSHNIGYYRADGVPTPSRTWHPWPRKWARPDRSGYGR